MASPARADKASGQAREIELHVPPVPLHGLAPGVEGLVRRLAECFAEAPAALAVAALQALGEAHRTRCRRARGRRRTCASAGGASEPGPDRPCRRPTGWRRPLAASSALQALAAPSGSGPKRLSSLVAVRRMTCTSRAPASSRPVLATRSTRGGRRHRQVPDARGGSGRAAASGSGVRREWRSGMSSLLASFSSAMSICSRRDTAHLLRDRLLQFEPVGHLSTRTPIQPLKQRGATLDLPAAKSSTGVLSHSAGRSAWRRLAAPIPLSDTWRKSLRLRRGQPARLARDHVAAPPRANIEDSTNSVISGRKIAADTAPASWWRAEPARPGCRQVRPPRDAAAGRPSSTPAPPPAPSCRS